MDKWIFIAAFHNLRINRQIETKYALIASYDSKIVQDICEESPDEFSNFIGNFKNQFGKKIYPSVFFLREDVVPNHDTIISFRNALALSSITESWEAHLKNSEQGQFYPYRYSNYFDFYPYSLSKDYKNLIAHTPSVWSIQDPSSFEGQSSPEIAQRPIFDNKFYDEYLFKEIVRRWEKYFIDKKSKNWADRVLFRSLEMAYRASVLPFGNQGTIHDYGANIALWVSAFEIMIHPKTSNVNIEKVIAFLGKIKYLTHKLNHRRYKITINKKPKKVTMIQKTYFEIYQTRNLFLHGNPVTMNDLFPNRDIKLEVFTASIPVIYKFALYQHLNLLNEPNQNDTEKWIKYNLRVGKMEDALSNIRRKSSKK